MTTIFNKRKSNKKVTLIISSIFILIIVGCIASWFLYQRNHIFSSYGLNPVGTINIDKKKVPKGWTNSLFSPTTNAVTKGISTFNTPTRDGANLTIQKVYNQSMKYSQAPALAAKLRSDKTQLMINAGYGITRFPASSVIVIIDNKKVRLPTVEFSEYYSNRFEESDAFYVQDGYYIDIQRQVLTDNNPHPNHAELMSLFNKALAAINVSN